MEANDCVLGIFQHFSLSTSNSLMKLLTLKAVFWTTFRGTQHKCFNDYLLLMYKQSYIQSYCLILETVNVSEDKTGINVILIYTHMSYLSF